MADEDVRAAVLWLASEDTLCVRIFGWQFLLADGGIRYLDGNFRFGVLSACSARTYALHMVQGRGENMDSCILFQISSASSEAFSPESLGSCGGMPDVPLSI